MIHAAIAGALLALGTSQTPLPAAGKTLWLVQSLYPGQEALVSRTEGALALLVFGTASGNDVVGHRQLAAFLADKKPDLSCLMGDVGCKDPVDAFVGAFGFERVVMLKGGQEDQAYRFKTTSYLPVTGEMSSSEGSGNNLDRALLASLVKIVPLASTIEVTTEPPGAFVYVDGEKVGVTPFQGQILPVERMLKVEIPSHMPVEKKIDVPARGALKFHFPLEKVPARITVTAAPAGTEIWVDGSMLGVDKIDKPIQPGKHFVELKLKGFKPYGTTLDIAPGGTGTLDQSLAPSFWTGFKKWLSSSSEDIYATKGYFAVNYEHTSLFGTSLSSRSINYKSHRLWALMSGGNKAFDRPLQGFSLEYGQGGKYLGFMVFGAELGFAENWDYTWVPVGPDKKPIPSDAKLITGGSAISVGIRGLQPNLRFAISRLVLKAQAGPEFRVLWLDGDAENTDGFVTPDLLLAAELTVQVHLVAGAYVQGSWRHTWPILSDTAGYRGFQVGVGYAF